MMVAVGEATAVSASVKKAHAPPNVKMNIVIRIKMRRIIE
jgi:hypothetical protein